MAGSVELGEAARAPAWCQDQWGSALGRRRGKRAAHAPHGQAPLRLDSPAARRTACRLTERRRSAAAFHGLVSAHCRRTERALQRCSAAGSSHLRQLLGHACEQLFSGPGVAFRARVARAATMPLCPAVMRAAGAAGKDARAVWAKGPAAEEASVGTHPRRGASPRPALPGVPAHRDDAPASLARGERGATAQQERPAKEVYWRYATTARRRSASPQRRGAAASCAARRGDGEKALRVRE